jgi:uracil permease
MAKKMNIPEEGIYDARVLGKPRMLMLGFQHMFAMFGATVLVPTLTGLDVGTTLLFAGLGTLLFHLLAKGKVPAFLGSSFAFLAGYFAIAPNKEPELLPYASFGVACAGLVYVLLAALFKLFGSKKVMRYFPPIVTGPIIIAIGLTLSKSAVDNCTVNWGIALVAIVIIVAANIWGKGMVKIVPILLGVIGSYLVAIAFDPVVRDNLAKTVGEAAWVGIPIHKSQTIFGLFSGKVDHALLFSAVVTIVPISLATMMEHIGDISAISATCRPQLHRGPGPAPHAAGRRPRHHPGRPCFGGPANTTYGENTGVLALSKIYDPRVIRIAACFAVMLQLLPEVRGHHHECIPPRSSAASAFVLYGMISAVGVRNVVENRVDFTKSRNVLVAAFILVLSIGIAYSKTGAIQIGVVNLSGLAVASIVGIALNAVMPGKDYEFGKDEQGDTAVKFVIQ